VSSYRKQSLKVVPGPGQGTVVSAPPVLNASDHTVDYSCGQCETVLMHADEGQVHNLTIRCTNCGSYNTTDG
jgi:DNA-directed RNA polymerase subunit RPC12/RpoP